MAWTTPRTWVAGEFVTDTLLNVHLRDQLLAAFPNGTTPLSWTPTITGTTSATGQAYSAQVGKYLRVGDEIRYVGRVTLSTLGTITGNVSIGGLPVAVGGSGWSPVVIGSWASMGANFMSIHGFADAGFTRIQLRATKAAAANSAALVQADLSATSDLIFGGSYFV